MARDTPFVCRCDRNSVSLFTLQMCRAEGADAPNDAVPNVTRCLTRVCLCLHTCMLQASEHPSIGLTITDDAVDNPYNSSLLNTPNSSASIYDQLFRDTAQSTTNDTKDNTHRSPSPPSPPHTSSAPSSPPQSAEASSLRRPEPLNPPPHNPTYPPPAMTPLPVPPPSIIISNSAPLGPLQILPAMPRVISNSGLASSLPPANPSGVPADMASVLSQPSAPPCWLQLSPFLRLPRSSTSPLPGLVILTTGSNPSPLNIRNAAESFGVVHTFRSDFLSSRGVLFVSYFDLRAAQCASAGLTAALERDVGVAGTNFHTFYCTPLHFASDLDETAIVITGLPDGVDEETIRVSMATYGDVKAVHEQVSQQAGGDLEDGTVSYLVKFYDMQVSDERLESATRLKRVASS